MGPDQFWGNTKKFVASIDGIHASRRQTRVHLRFDAYGILGEKQGVNIKIEWYRRITQLAYPVHRIQSSSHANLDHLFSERANIRNYIDVSGANVGGSIVHIIQSLVHISQLLAHSRCSGFVSILYERFDRIGIVLSFLFKTSALIFDFLLDFTLLAQALTFRALRLFLLSLLLQEVRCDFEFANA